MSRAESFWQFDENLYWILFVDYNWQAYWIVSDWRIYAALGLSTYIGKIQAIRLERSFDAEFDGIQ